jgi:hypothetical protein
MTDIFGYGNNSLICMGWYYQDQQFPPNDMIKKFDKIYGLNRENPMKQLFVTLLLLLFAVSSLGKEQPVIKDPAKLVGKKVNVHNIPLCQPGTHTADLAHAGKQATVVSAKPNKTPAMSPAFTNRLTPEARALLDDQQKAATLLLQFEDGMKLETCTPIGPQGLAYYLEMIP